MKGGFERAVPASNLADVLQEKAAEERGVGGLGVVVGEEGMDVRAITCSNVGEDFGNGGLVGVEKMLREEAVRR